MGLRRCSRGNAGGEYRPPVEPQYRPPVEREYRPPVEPQYRPPVKQYRPPVEEPQRGAPTSMRSTASEQSFVHHSARTTVDMLLAARAAHDTMDWDWAIGTG
jgi:hypothetical protein